MKDFAGRTNKYNRLDFNNDGVPFYANSVDNSRKHGRTENNGFSLLPAKSERSKVEYAPCKKYVGKAAIKRMQK